MRMHRTSKLVKHFMRILLGWTIFEFFWATYISLALVKLIAIMIHFIFWVRRHWDLRLDWNHKLTFLISLIFVIFIKFTAKVLVRLLSLCLILITSSHSSASWWCSSLISNVTFCIFVYTRYKLLFLTAWLKIAWVRKVFLSAIQIISSILLEVWKVLTATPTFWSLLRKIWPISIFIFRFRNAERSEFIKLISLIIWPIFLLSISVRETFFLPQSLSITSLISSLTPSHRLLLRMHHISVVKISIAFLLHGCFLIILHDFRIKSLLILNFWLACLSKPIWTSIWSRKLINLKFIRAMRFHIWPVILKNFILSFLSFSLEILILTLNVFLVFLTFELTNRSSWNKVHFIRLFVFLVLSWWKVTFSKNGLLLAHLNHTFLLSF